MATPENKHDVILKKFADLIKTSNLKQENMDLLMEVVYYFLKGERPPKPPHNA